MHLNKNVLQCQVSSEWREGIIMPFRTLSSYAAMIRNVMKFIRLCEHI